MRSFGLTLDTLAISLTTYLTVAVVLALGVAALSAALCATLWATFLTSLAGVSAGFCATELVLAGAVVGVAAKALTEIRPATRVAISLFIS